MYNIQTITKRSKELCHSGTGKGGKFMSKKLIRKKSVKILVSVLLAFSLILQMSSGSQAKATPKLNKTKVTLTLGNTVDLVLQNSSSKPKWSSSKKSVATVNSSGEVLAKAAGTAKISAKVGTKQYVCKVTVPKQYINNTSITLNTGESKNLIMYGVAKEDVIFWCSDNEDVARISSSGKVTAVKNGKTAVYAILNAGLGKTYKCTVTVIGDKDQNPPSSPKPSVSPSPSPSGSPKPSVSPTPTPVLDSENYYNGAKIVEKLKDGFYGTETIDVSKYFTSDNINTYVLKTESSNKGTAYVDKIIDNHLVVVRTGGFTGTAYITLTCNTEKIVLQYAVEHKPINITSIYLDVPGSVVTVGDKVKVHIDTMMDNEFKNATVYLKSYEPNMPSQIVLTEFTKDPRAPYSYVGEFVVTKDMMSGMWGFGLCMLFDDKGYVEMINSNGTVNEFADTCFFYVR